MITASPTDDHASPERRIQELTKELSQARGELAEAREQQAATADILRVISSSPTDLQPVFAEIAASAARLCDAYDAVIRQVDGDVLRLVAHYGPIPTTPVGPFSRGAVPGRATLDQETIHIADLQAETGQYPEGSERARRLGFRTILAVPLMRAGDAIGVIVVRRTDVRPFTDLQIELLKTFADQAVIAIENTRLFDAEQARTKEIESKSAQLRESLEYQTATSEVLGVISRSPTNVQPVFDTIAQSAAQLCEAQFCHVFRFDGHLIHFAASHGQPQSNIDHMRRMYPIPPGQVSAAARSVLTCAVEEIPDIHADPEYQHGHIANYRSIVAVPMLKDGRPVGAICMARTEIGTFPKRQVELLKTFADQAVIAIENTRLFEAEQASKRELQESLEYQTATSKVLSVIGSSPGDLAPVFDAMLTNAVRICEAKFGVLFRYDGNVFQPAATLGVPPAYTEFLQKRGSFRPTSGAPIHRLMQTEELVQIIDNAAEQYPGPAGKYGGARSLIAVPMRKEKVLIGAFVIYRTEVRPFTDKQIELVKGFASQAVIAIENVRLLNELRESLQQQTATADVLKVISRSPFQLQTIFNTLVEAAARLCEADTCGITRQRGTSHYHVAHYGFPPGLFNYLKSLPLPSGRASLVGRVLLEGGTVQIADASEDPDYRLVEAQRVGGYRTLLGVPLLREGGVIGVLTLTRSKVQPFTKRQIELLTTFADQAVIAIENTRLFEELQARTRELTESLQQQTGTAEVLKVISRSAFDLRSVLQALVESAARLCDADKGTITRQIDGVFYRAESHGFPAEVMDRWRNVPVTPERGSAAGRALLEARAVHVPDAAADPDYTFDTAGARTMLGVPMLREGEPIGVLALARSDVRPFTDKQIDLVSTFADQAAIAIENVRLFEEVQARTRELAQTVEDLEIASQHKSQFVANMSHELRTPLAAILGYAELMQEGFYEPLGQKSLDALTRIRSNGKHLLGLINTVLDIAKIESGQFTLNMAEYAMESVVETVRSATESLAQNKKLALKTEVAKSLPIGLGDEQRLTQVLLNLVGNAIKFTDAGEVRVTAKAINGHFNVSVTDTGPGIPDHERTRIFEQFHQLDSSLTKAAGGTGLGLAIAKQIVEMHGGRIWVESTLGKGSTFQMELPARADFRQRAV